MKKMMMTLALMMTIVVSAAAMSRNEARYEARKTTDRMAVMFDLTKRQYDRVLSINVDYYRSLDGRHDDRDLRTRNARLERVLTREQLHRYYNRGTASAHKGWRHTDNRRSGHYGRH